MIDERRKISRELHGNQNYLNFIKKNHLCLYAYAHLEKKKSTISALIKAILIIRSSCTAVATST